MAQHQYDFVLGNTYKDVEANQSSGSSISTSAVRVTIDDTNCPSKLQALEALEQIKLAVTEGVWPPTP